MVIFGHPCHTIGQYSPGVTRRLKYQQLGKLCVFTAAALIVQWLSFSWAEIPSLPPPGPLVMGAQWNPFAVQPAVSAAATSFASYLSVQYMCAIGRESCTTCTRLACQDLMYCSLTVRGPSLSNFVQKHTQFTFQGS